MVATKPKKQYISGPQVILDRGFGTSPSVNGAGEGKARLIPNLLLSDRKFGEMLRDPTIKLATKIQTAMLIMQPWIVDGLDDDFCAFCYDQIEPHRTKIVRSSMRGIYRYGWRAFELVYEFKETPSSKLDGPQPCLVGCKPLRNELTTPLVWQDTGEFAGLETRDTAGNINFIDADHAMLINADEEYIGELGFPSLRSAQETYQKWEVCDRGAQRYDDKVAGGFLCIQYPVGQTKVMSGNTETVQNNALIAKQFAEQVKSAGYGILPRRQDPETGEYKESDWVVDHIMSSGGGMQPNFIAREKYLDALKLRSFGVPERAATEGSFGTKAEAEAHLSVAIATASELQEFMISGVNDGYMKPVSREVMGDENAARMRLGQLSEADKTSLVSIFLEYLKDPTSGKFIRQRTDVKQLMDKIEVPSTDIPQFEEEEPQAVPPGLNGGPPAPPVPPVPGQAPGQKEDAPPVVNTGVAKT